MSYNKETGLYEGYIYKITNNINGKLYIGQTTTTVEHRIGQHFSKQQEAYHGILKYAINKYGKDNFSYEMLAKIECETRSKLCEELNNLEIKMIKKYNSITPNGYNISEGGNSHVFLGKPTAVYDIDGNLLNTFDSCSEAARFMGVDPKIVFRMCSGELHKSRKTDYIFRYLDDDFNTYDPFTTKRQYKIYQFTIDGKLINKYNNAQDVVAQNPSMNSNLITRAVNSKGLYKNYYWSKNDYFDFDINEYQKWHPVDQYSLNGELLKQWNNISEAIESLNINCGSRICEQTIGKIFVPVCGYIWRDRNHPFDEFKVDYDIRKTKQPVDQYTINGEYLGSYQTIKEAAEVNNIPKTYLSHISKCCKGKANYAVGYVWRYKGDSFDKYKVNTDFKTKQSVDQYDIDGNFINTFPTIKEAILSIGQSEKLITNISSVCRGKTKTAFGYVWRYHGEPFGNFVLDVRHKHINKYDLDNNYIETFHKGIDAAKSLNKPGEAKKYSGTIIHHLDNPNHIAYGYKWYYADDPNQPDKTKIINNIYRSR